MNSEVTPEAAQDGPASGQGNLGPLGGRSFCALPWRVWPDTEFWGGYPCPSAL